MKCPVFATVVTDFSHALMNAAVNTLGKVRDLSEYVNSVFEIIETAPSIFHVETVLKVCCVHFMKIIVNDTKKLTENKIKNIF